jgi:hypothetical protein
MNFVPARFDAGTEAAAVFMLSQACEIVVEQSVRWSSIDVAREILVCLAAVIRGRRSLGAPNRDPEVLFRNSGFGIAVRLAIR